MLRKKICLVIIKIYQFFRIKFFKTISDATVKHSKFTQNVPIFFSGRGRITIGTAHIGIYPSPYFFSSNGHIESRNISAEVIIGNGVFINNNFTVICDKSKIEIGDNCLIGTNCTIYDSDFHHLEPSKRMEPGYACRPVKIHNNVFIGANVLILKGSEIGDNTVVASGSVVCGIFPSNVIIGGVPAKVIKVIDNE